MTFVSKELLKANFLLIIVTYMTDEKYHGFQVCNLPGSCDIIYLVSIVTKKIQNFQKPTA